MKTTIGNCPHCVAIQIINCLEEYPPNVCGVVKLVLESEFLYSTKWYTREFPKETQLFSKIKNIVMQPSFDINKIIDICIELGFIHTSKIKDRSRWEKIKILK